MNNKIDLESLELISRSPIWIRNLGCKVSAQVAEYVLKDKNDTYCISENLEVVEKFIKNNLGVDFRFDDIFPWSIGPFKMKKLLLDFIIKEPTRAFGTYQGERIWERNVDHS